MISFDDQIISFKMVDKISKNFAALELQRTSKFIIYYHV